MKIKFLTLILFICTNIPAQEVPDGMVLIPGGEFIMGKNTPNPTDWQPEHKVSVDAFYMDKYEVTNSQYSAFCKATGTPLPEFWGEKRFKCGPDFPDHPVTGVSFFDAEKYAKWAGKRLPTEAEWEYAARGGLPAASYPWGENVDSTKVNYGKRYGGTLRVGTLPPNGYGLYDITGNVWEWTTDFYSDSYYSVSPAKNPAGPAGGRFKVIRGGSWHSGGMCVQTYYRNGLSPSWIDFGVGFRCVKPVLVMK
jgi:iron(II)-dependent oxidoreductase